MFESLFPTDFLTNLRSWRMAPMLIWRLILFSSGLVATSLGVWVWYASQHYVQVPQTCQYNGPLSEEKQATVASKLVVDINGAINKPGIYELESGSRYADIIELAGGLKKTASKEFVAKKLNLSQLVKDQEKIYLPFAGEEAGVAVVAEQKISINRATLAELQQLVGVGEVTAQKIIAGRPYASLLELQNIVSQKVYTDNFNSLEI